MVDVMHRHDANNDEIFVKHYGREMLRELFMKLTMKLIKCMEPSGTGVFTLGASDREDIRELFAHHKLITKATKSIQWDRYRVYGQFHSDEAVFRIIFKNGSGRMLMNFELTPSLKELVFSDKELA